MIETLLNAEERKIYRLSRIERKNTAQILAKMQSSDSTYSLEKLRDTFKKMDRKIYVSARYDVLSALTEKYVRVLKVLRDYFEEKSTNKEHVFNIDFSDVYVYLNPWELAKDTESQIIRDNNFGSIYYMLNSKHKNNYCMLPPAIWEAINKLDATKNLLEQTSPDTVIKNLKTFHSLMDSEGKNSEIFRADLMTRYKAMGSFLSILNLANKGELRERSRSNCTNTVELLSGRIKRMDDFVGDVEKIGIHEGTYEDAMQQLNRRRPGESINNTVDAANVAITYDLTAETGKCFRLVSHSRQPSLAFRNIAFKKDEQNKKQTAFKYHHDVFLACCPQFVATVILAETNQLRGFDPNDFKNKNSTYFTESIRVLEGIKSQYTDLKYGQIYLRSWNMGEHTALMEKELVNQTAHMENALNSLYNHLVDLPAFRNQIYPNFIGSVLDINSSGTESYKKASDEDLKVSLRKNCHGFYEEDIEDLLQMCKKEQRYKVLIEEATGIIHDELKETYKKLGKYVEGKYKHLLKPNMQSLLDELHKEM